MESRYGGLEFFFLTIHCDLTFYALFVIIHRLLNLKFIHIFDEQPSGFGRVDIT